MGNVASRKKGLSILLIFAMIFSLVPVISAAEDATNDLHTVTFSVYDSVNKDVYNQETPIAGAQITVERAEQSEEDSVTSDVYGPITTDEEGKASFEELADGEYTYTVTKDGYETKTGSLVVDGEDVAIAVGLTPLVLEIKNQYAFVFVGDQYQLPGSIKAKLGHTWQDVPVTWEAESVDTSTAGAKVVNGTAENGEDVSLTVFVLEAVEVTAENGTALFDGASLGGLPEGATVKAGDVPTDAGVFGEKASRAGAVKKFNSATAIPSAGLQLELELNEGFAGEAGLAYYNEALGQWELVSGSEQAEGKVQATIREYGVYGAIELNAEIIANGIKSIPSPGRGATQLSLPEVPEGYAVSIHETSNPNVINTNGTITPLRSSTSVGLVLEVTKLNSNDSALTEQLSVTVPGTRSSSGGSGGSGGGGSTPDTDRSREIIASQGGTFSYNGVTVSVPANAFDRDFIITIERLSRTSNLPFASNQHLVSDVFEITKDRSGNFTRPVTITLPFDASKVDFDEQEVALFWLDEDEEEWVELDNIRVNQSSERVSGQVDHFTKFAVLATDTAEEQEEDTPQVNLTDIAGHWAEAQIKALVEKGAINGYPNGTFRPNNTITRAEFAKIIVHAFNLEDRDGKVFADTANHWARDVIATAAAHDIVRGHNATTFGPDEQITREQMAVMIARAINLEASAGGSSFTDSASISYWATGAINAAVQAGIIEGYPNNTFLPQGSATRAEAVTIIVKALEYNGQSVLADDEDDEDAEDSEDDEDTEEEDNE